MNVFLNVVPLIETNHEDGDTKTRMFSWIYAVVNYTPVEGLFGLLFIPFAFT